MLVDEKRIKLEVLARFPLIGEPEEMVEAISRTDEEKDSRPPPGSAESCPTCYKDTPCARC